MLGLFSTFPEDVLYNISLFLDIYELKSFKYTNKSTKNSVDFNKKIVKMKIIEGKYNFIPENIAYNIGKEFIKDKMINDFIKILPYCKKPYSLSIFCRMDFENSKILIENMRRYPFTVEYKELVDDGIIMKVKPYNYCHYISNYIYYMIAKWTFGTNLEIFRYCVSKGCDIGYTYLYNEDNFYPMDEEEKSHYRIMTSILRGYT